MTELVPTPDPVEEQPQSERKNSALPIIVALTALLLSGGLAVYTYLEREHQFKTAESISQQSELIEKIHSGQQQTSTFLKEQSAKLQSLTDEYTQLSSLVHQDQESWALAEVDYLVRLANYTVQYVGNASTAKKLLETADQRLETLANPKLATIRSTLGDNIIQLGANNEVDVEKLLNRLEKLSAHVAELSILSEAKLSIAKDNSGPSINLTSDWKEKLQDSLHSLQSVVIVRHLSAPPKPLASPDQHANLVENIQLKFAIAQWAVLHRKQSVYVSSLAQAKTWINEYFRKDDLSLAVINGISELEQAQISPAMPDLSKVVVAVHETIQDLAKNHPSAAAPTPTQPEPNQSPAQVPPKHKPEVPAKEDVPTKPEVLSS